MTGQQHDAAVVIVTRNRTDGRKRAARSAIWHTGADVQVLVVDEVMRDLGD